MHKSHSFEAVAHVLGLFFFFRVRFTDGDIGITSLFFETAAEVIVAAIYRTGPAFACHKVMTVCGFDFVATGIAADCISDNHLLILLEKFIDKVCAGLETVDVGLLIEGDTQLADQTEKVVVIVYGQRFEEISQLGEDFLDLRWVAFVGFKVGLV